MKQNSILKNAISKQQKQNEALKAFLDKNHETSQKYEIISSMKDKSEITGAAQEGTISKEFAFGTSH